MKAIILAGGLGTRLGKYTENLPKGMLNFAGKSLIERQIETLRKCGIKEIIVTRKHLKEKINFPDVKYDDKEQDDSNMVSDFMHARREFDDDLILCYGDIIYEPSVLKELIKSKAEISVVADKDWKEYWIARLGDWRNDSESFVVRGKKLVSLGMPNPPENLMDARYVGMIKFSKKSLKKIEDIYDALSEKIGWETKWSYSKSFKKAYMTDLVQELIENGFNVEAVLISHKWMEFDTAEDYEKANDWLDKGTLKRFINL